MTKPPLPSASCVQALSGHWQETRGARPLAHGAAPGLGNIEGEGELESSGCSEGPEPANKLRSGKEAGTRRSLCRAEARPAPAGRIGRCRGKGHQARHPRRRRGTEAPPRSGLGATPQSAVPQAGGPTRTQGPFRLAPPRWEDDPARALRPMRRHSARVGPDPQARAPSSPPSLGALTCETAVSPSSREG